MLDIFIFEGFNTEIQAIYSNLDSFYFYNILPSSARNDE